MQPVGGRGKIEENGVGAFPCCVFRRSLSFDIRFHIIVKSILNLKVVLSKKKSIRLRNSVTMLCFIQMDRT
jgi:hypothetical protein